MNKNALKKIQPFDFFLLVYAFLYGNLFAIQFSTLDWGIIMIFGLVFLLELIQKVLYFAFSKKHEKSLYSKLQNLGSISLLFVVNTLKRGFLLGFFLEAFKVGS